MFFREFDLPKAPTFPPLSVSICDFGAREGEDASCAIAAAIDHVFSHGGGRVVIPSGLWLSAAIHLKSNVELHLEEGAVVSFSTVRQDYLPLVLINYEGIRCYNYSPMIYANGEENIAVTGKGRFEANGPEWWAWARTSLDGRNRLYKMMVDTPVSERIFGKETDYLRSPFLQILNSKNVLVEDVYIHNSPFWTVHIAWCEGVTVRGITIENETMSPNTDGINIDASRCALVENCTLKTLGDDMICLKAGRNQDAWDVGKSCEDVLVRNCRGIGECRSGGIVIGSEMSGSVRNVRAENCEFENNINCVRIKSKDGRGGVVENIEYKNLKMKKGMRGINLTFRYSSEATDAPDVPGKYMPEYRNIYFENIECDNLDIGIAIDGVEGGVMENICMKDINMRAVQCMTADSVSCLNMSGVSLTEIKKNS